MDVNMFRNLSERTAHQNWKTALLLFAVIASVHFTAAFLKSLLINLFGMMLYALLPLIFVKRRDWKEIRIKKPISSTYILWGTLLTALFILASYTIHYCTVNFSSSNFMAIMAKQQLNAAVTKYNAWQIFPIAALGFVTISPLTEEFFFRGLLMKASEKRFSAFSANLLQALLFSFVHLAYYWMTEFNLGIIIPTFLATPLPLFWGWMVQKTDSLLSSMIPHAVHNFIAIFLVYAFIIPAIG